MFVLTVPTKWIIILTICLLTIYPVINFNAISGTKHTIAKRSISLENRHANPAINNVFKNNILLTIAYASGKIYSKQSINWTEINEPFYHEITLKPGESFAFHENVLDAYAQKTTATTNSRFNSRDGFLSDGYLFGNGVCHLASLMGWVAKDAGLLVLAPVDHDFAAIPDIPKEYGVSIYYSPGGERNTQNQNLYIENNQTEPIIMIFEYENNKLNFQISKSITQNTSSHLRRSGNNAKILKGLKVEQTIPI